MKQGISKMTVWAGVVALALGGVAGAEVTFTKDVLPILQENCQTCHRPSGTNLSGMIAPMSFMTYEEVRPWSKAIVKAVTDKVMPPWDASPEFHGVFANERTLTDEEIATITAWVQQGARRGNPNDAPAPLSFPETGWNFGEPDLVGDLPASLFVKGENEDWYDNITTVLTDEQLSEDRWIRSVEFKPGSEVVHHIIGHATSADHAGDTTRGMLGGNAPGADQSEWPAGYGIHLPKGSAITFAMHYHKEPGPGTGKWDSSQIGFQFHPKEMKVTHPVNIFPISHGAFEIPPYHSNWKVGSSFTFEEDTTLLSMLPHMHLRGTKAKYTAFYPDGTSELLRDAPQWDGNWQTGYDLAEPKTLPAGTRVEMEFWYNNSEDRAAYAGFNAARAISFGGPTTDEMDLAWMTVAPKAEKEFPGD